MVDTVGAGTMPRSMKQWKEFGEWLVDKIYSEIHYFCWHISGDPVGECFASHAEDDLYSLAEIYINPYDEYEIFNGVYVDGEQVLNILRKMPDNLYHKYNKKLQRMLEDTYKEVASDSDEDD